jgi:ABC-type spermidine/putrescine transport system permease subunit I
MANETATRDVVPSPPRFGLNLPALLILPALTAITVYGWALADLFWWSAFPQGNLATGRQGDFTFANYLKLFGDELYREPIWVTLRLSAIATIASLLLGLPIAYWMARTESRTTRFVLITMIAIPFMTSLIVRLYALLLVLANTGLINTLLHRLGIIAENDFLPLIRNEIGVSIGLAYFVLPFVIFTLAAVFKRLDGSLEDAAHNLGADEVTTFFRITLPLIVPGILGAGTLAFILAGTAFATPLVLGGSAVRMLANAIYDQAMVAQNIPMAAALSVVALVVTVTLMVVAARIFGGRHA